MSEPLEPLHRTRCYACYRPESQCFCDLIPSIKNQTDVLILQHTRERFHAFNTARIVHQALQSSRIEVGFTPDLVDRADAVSPNAGLLYPGDGARLIDDVPVGERPDQIVVLDGTWHHAKTMLRDIPWLHDLPRFRIDPASPSRYRIRREPSVESLSTVEATVDILRAIEPGTRGLDELLVAFNTMIDRHIDVIGTAAPRHRVRAETDNRVATNIPRSLLGNPDDIVVAYGESVPKEANRRRPNVPVVWVAQRLGTGEQFRAVIQPPYPVPAEVLGHIELKPSDFETAMTETEFREQWLAFSKPEDVIFVYGRGTRKLLSQVGIKSRCELLKAIDFALPTDDVPHTLHELLTQLDVHPEPATLPGRAGRRLANAIALANFARGHAS